MKLKFTFFAIGGALFGLFLAFIGIWYPIAYLMGALVCILCMLMPDDIPPG